MWRSPQADGIQFKVRIMGTSLFHGNPVRMLTVGSICLKTVMDYIGIGTQDGKVALGGHQHGTKVRFQLSAPYFSDSAILMGVYFYC